MVLCGPTTRVSTSKCVRIKRHEMIQIVELAGNMCQLTPIHIGRKFTKIFDSLQISSYVLLYNTANLKACETVKGKQTVHGMVDSKMQAVSVGLFFF